MNRSLKLPIILSSLLTMTILLTGCISPAENVQPSPLPSTEPSAAPSETAASVIQEEPEYAYILFTTDIHCGIDEGFGLVGLEQIRNVMNQKGIPNLLVDNGDAIQGDVIGTLTEGLAITRLMNRLHYDAAVPGNHEFDFGWQAFETVVKTAEFPYLSCNITKNGTRMFEPTRMCDLGPFRIGFIGITTPDTLRSTNIVNLENEEGERIFDFMQDDSGDLLYEEVQKNIDQLKKDGADYVVALCHLGSDESDDPYNFQNLIERTSGLSAVLDGHSHDTHLVTMNDRDGNPVPRADCGTKMEAIGYMRIHLKDGTVSTGLYTWNNTDTPASLFGIANELTEPLNQELAAVDVLEKQVIGKTDFPLLISDAEEKDENGAAVRQVRRKETNLADFYADVIKYYSKAECVIVNGGGVRSDIRTGEITRGDIIRTFPFSNQICVSLVSGQTILDALEWGTSHYPSEAGAFPQVSGITYELHAANSSSCMTDIEGNFSCSLGVRRVQNVKINGEPVDPKRKYRLASIEFLLKNGSDGYKMFDPEEIIMDQIGVDNQYMINYIVNVLKGVIPSEYENPAGSGRITIIED